ncbi:bifunctional 4-hydroxy-2-oxoglutarate aldolase/2-dehydro-3-deoxy-phosphogluconate aldolase [Streptomyces roseirectus]|uniref:Bifunctional 4-hydroxy-2-oxoglutarate aldolase/2-dehydro-3-deoxy-phosphogluconate aldolase n=1 Tax=Streptomyces roseirectus TaxID=2768066 RepID=A0A7H0I9T4_9ACTN|nr:bifunctional 4-hydroxy-2-oxoglutarate aldolase/2-dehydro-3-deoxy-phosphogluconate aldolase [Streptomyces roseirectus]QNP69550.1 bifunctional 4-hydroxy-2-oxoglutarate aldolase/2-dehydro-3-deoxy-phosphogluconate aldolase [Streptomyces roseirectus]
MVTKFTDLETITRTGALLIVRLDSAEEALAVAEAAVEGGIRALEITLSVPGALGVISTLAARYGDDVLVGAGTVLDAPSAVACVQAGARLLVSPNLEPEMIAAANRYQAVTVSGAFTPTEIVRTLEAGADIVKLFPAEFSGGASYVRTVRAPLSRAPIMPAGGVTPDNVKEWFDAGVVAVGVGSFVTKAARGDGDYRRVTEAASVMLRAIEEARN